jgi:hypothetical protein
MERPTFQSVNQQVTSQMAAELLPPHVEDRRFAPSMNEITFLAQQSRVCQWGRNVETLSSRR